MKVVILAAGKGTRFGEITKTTPKSLLKVANKPIIEHALEALPPEISEVILVIGHLGNKIKDHLGREYRGRKIKYIALKNLNGTAGALWAAKKLLKKQRFLVLNGDDIYSRKELALCLRHKRAFGLAKNIPPGPKYLAIQIDKNKNIKGFRYPTAKEMTSGINIATGAYVIDSTIFKYKPVKLSNGELGLPQTILKMAQKYRIKGVLMKNWIQINRPEDIIKVELKLRN